MTFCKSKFSKNHCLKLYLCKRKVFGDAFIQPRRFHYEERYLFLSCFLHNSNFLILVLLLILFYRVHKIDWIIQKSFIKCKKKLFLTTLSLWPEGQIFWKIIHQNLLHSMISSVDPRVNFSWIEVFRLVFAPVYQLIDS